MEFSRFDKLIFLVKESDLPIEAILPEIKELFTDFEPESDCYNDKFLPLSVIDIYAYNRSLGVPLIEVAHSLKMTATLLSELHNGKRLSLKKLVDLAEAETFAPAEMKVTHLARLEKSESKLSTIMFLEKAYSKQFGDKDAIDLVSGFNEAVKDHGWDVVVTHVNKNMGDKTARDDRIKE